MHCKENQHSFLFLIKYVVHFLFNAKNVLLICCIRYRHHRNSIYTQMLNSNNITMTPESSRHWDRRHRFLPRFIFCSGTRQSRVRVRPLCVIGTRVTVGQLKYRYCKYDYLNIFYFVLIFLIIGILFWFIFFSKL